MASASSSTNAAKISGWDICDLSLNLGKVSQLWKISVKDHTAERPQELKVVSFDFESDKDHGKGSPQIYLPTGEILFGLVVVHLRVMSMGNAIIYLMHQALTQKPEEHLWMMHFIFLLTPFSWGS